MKALDHTSDLQAGFLGAFMKPTVQDKGPRVVCVSKAVAPSTLFSDFLYMGLNDFVWGKGLRQCARKILGLTCPPYSSFI